MTHRTSIISRHLSQIIHAHPDAVYEYAANPANLPRWASGLATAAVRDVGDRLVVDSPMGEVTIRFTPANDLGVLDHDVTLPSGATTTNPVRVLAHPEGAEVVFTVRQIDLTDDEFDRDTATIQRDLLQLKDLLEQGPAPQA